MKKGATAETIAAAIERTLAPLGNPARAEFMAAGYAPSALRNLGVGVPAMRAVVRQFTGELQAAPASTILAIGRALVARGTVEGRQVGYELIARRRDAFSGLDARLIQRLGKGNDNWASVDGFAAYISGPAWRANLISDRDVRGWATSTNVWWRRTALASAVALNRAGRSDSRRTLDICRIFVGETDPMLAKALSWALRSLVRGDRAGVSAFLSTHANRLPAVVRREVTTKLK